MLEFLSSNYFMVFYTVAMVLSVVKYRFYFDTVLKYFPIIIGYTLLSETLGIFIRDVEEFQIIYEKGYAYYNQLIFNIFDIVFFLYFFYVFRNTANNGKVKRFIEIGALIFIAVALINPFLQDISIFPQIYTIVVGSIILITCIINYMVVRNKFKENKKEVNLLSWISTGLLIFYLFYPIIMSLGILDYELYEHLQLYKVLRTLIAIMYGFFIIGFIKTKKRLTL